MTTLISTSTIRTFQGVVWDYYRAHRRAMPWRREPAPYFVLVSEMMLQQTQVSRVQQKFITFVRRFPTVQTLASASLAEVLEVWTGLGYNRRAKYLWQAAQVIVRDFGGEIPRTQAALTTLPGIGTNTAGAILAYAYNEPVVFIETNIRTVFIHHFFADHADAVSDDELRALVAQTMPPQSPREWYWALMDYGTHLKATVGGQLQRVKNYKPQSKFEGSNRQLRGMLLRELVRHKQIPQEEFCLTVPDARMPEVIEALIKEGMVTRAGGLLQLARDN